MGYRTHLLLAACFSFSGISSALALEPQDFAERLNQLMVKQGSNLTYESLSESGSGFTLNEVRIKPNRSDEAGAFTIGDLSFSGISENGSGSYLAQSVTTSDVEEMDGGTGFSIKGISMANLELPVPGSKLPLLYDNFTIESIAVSAKDLELFSLDNLQVNSEMNDDKTDFTFDTDVQSFMVNLMEIVEPSQKPIIEEIGYDILEGTMDMDGGWNATTGRLALNDFNIDVKDAGKLTLALDIDGYTMEFAEALGNVSTDLESQSSQMALLGLMQQINYRGSSLRFDDDSLAGRIMDFQAKRQGTDRAGIANVVKALVPFMTVQLNKPEFSKALSAAIGAFLDNPNNIEVTATPGSPIPVSNLVAVGTAQPQQLIDDLAVTVTANQ